MPRSRVYVQALEAFWAAVSEEGITRRLDEVHRRNPDTKGPQPLLRRPRGGRQIEGRLHDEDDASDFAGAAPDKVARHALRNEAGVVESLLGPLLGPFEAEQLRQPFLSQPA